MYVWYVCATHSTAHYIIFIEDPPPKQTDTYQADLNMAPFLLVSHHYRALPPSPQYPLWNLWIIGTINKSFLAYQQLQLAHAGMYVNYKVGMYCLFFAKKYVKYFTSPIIN